MGNCLGRASNTGSNFKGPGRTLGSSSGVPPARPVQAPASAGGDAGGGPGGRTVGVPQANVVGGSAGDGVGGPRAAAAQAAEQRASQQRESAQSGGRLAKNLAAQKALTNEETLRAGADAERRFREVDRGTQALSHS